MTHQTGHLFEHKAIYIQNKPELNQFELSKVIVLIKTHIKQSIYKLHRRYK